MEMINIRKLSLGSMLIFEIVLREKKRIKISAIFVIVDFTL